MKTTSSAVISVSPLRARHPPCARTEAAGSGSRTVKRLPFPSSLLTSIVPPWASTMPHVTASPSPVPCVPLVVKNGSKRCGRSAGGDPAAAVLDDDLGEAGALRRRRARPDTDPAPVGDGVCRVHQQVHDHLLDLVRVGRGLGQVRRQLEVERHVVQRQRLAA